MNQKTTNMQTQSAPPVLQIQNLSVCTADQGNQRTVVRDISLEIHSGEILCIVGESGSGKSVTSYSVMGLLDPESLRVGGGRILLDGENLLDATSARLRQLRATRMSMIFQEPMTALNPVQKVGRQIDEVLRIHSRKSAGTRRQAVLEMLDSVHMPDPQRIYDSYPHQLSGGQRQRVVICMALILQPRLLIADEPTTALDVTTQKQILALIRELQIRNKMAVLFITHDFGVVAEIADRIVVMNKGSIVETGTREQILRNPVEPYSRMLVSSVPSLVPKHNVNVGGETILDVSGLSKIYSDKKLFGAGRHVKAADKISLVLRKGETLGVVGESGSGKSTVARCIVRLLRPSSGSVLVQGKDIAGMSEGQLRPMRQRIQIVFQDPYRSLNPRLSVGDSIIEGMVNYGTPRAKAIEKARELMQVVGLEKSTLNNYPHQFSGGQRQRICIARALALDPDILIADEAVSALDVSVQAQVLTLLDEIRLRTGVGLLFITHDLRVAAQICDSIVVMQGGSIVEYGPAQDVLTQPEQAYTRSLIEAAPGRHWDFQNFRPIAEGIVNLVQG